MTLLSEIISNLQLEQLSEHEWVCDVIDKGFTSTGKLPITYANTIKTLNISRILQNACTLLREQLTTPPTWREILADNQQAHLPVLTLLYYLISKGHGNKSNYNEREIALLASTLYILLITVPLSEVLDIYNENLYLKSIMTLEDCLNPDNIVKLSDTNLKPLTSFITMFLNDLNGAMKHLNLVELRSLRPTIEMLVHTLVSLKSATTKTMEIVAISIMNMLVEIPGYLENNFRLNAILLTMWQMKLFLMHDHPYEGATQLPKDHNDNMSNAGRCFGRLISNYPECTEKAFLFVKKMTYEGSNEKASADLRRRRVSSILTLVHYLPVEYYRQYMEFFYKFAFSADKAYRIFAQELIMGLFPWCRKIHNKLPAESIDPKLEMKLTSLIMLIIFDRCNDPVEDVILKALNSLTVAVSSWELDNIMKAVFEDDVSILSTICFDETKHQLPVGSEALSLLVIRLSHPKIGVRLAALHCVETMATLKPRAWITSSMLSQISLMVRDPSIKVKQLAVKILTNYAIKHENEGELMQEWVKHVLIHTINQNPKIAEQVIENLNVLVLKNLVPYPDLNQAKRYSMPWVVLSHIHSTQGRQYLECACRHWKANNEIKPSIISVLETYIKSEYHLEALMFMAVISKFLAPINAALYHSMCHDFCTRELDSMNSIYQLRFVLEVIVNWKSDVSSQVINGFCDQMIGHLTIGLFPPGLLTNVFHTINALQSLAWVSNIIKVFEKRITVGLEKMLLGESFNVREYEIAILSFSEACLNFSTPMNENLCRKICASINPTSYGVQVLHNNHSTLQSSLVQAIAKFCILDEQLAAEAIPAIAKLIQTGNSQTKVTAIVVMKDLCAPYTFLIEANINTMILALKDSNRSVRLTALKMASEIVSSGYIKLQQQLFWAFMSLVVDKDTEVRIQINDFLTCYVLVEKDLFSINLSRSLFYFNAQPQNELGRLFSLYGDDKKTDRQGVLGYMVRKMEPEQKMKALDMMICLIGKAGEDAYDLSGDKLYIVYDVIHLLTNHLLTASELKLRPESQENESNTTANKVVEHFKIAVYVRHFLRFKGRLKKPKLHETLEFKHLLSKLKYCVEKFLQEFGTHITESIINKQLTEDLLELTDGKIKFDDKKPWQFKVLI